MASLASLRLAGHASIAAARRFHAAAQIAHCEQSRGAERLWPVPLPPALPCCRLLPSAEGDVGDATRAVHGLNLETVFERLQPVPEPLPAAQHDGHHDDVRIVDQAGGQEFADGGRAAAYADIPVEPSAGRRRAEG